MQNLVTLDVTNSHLEIVIFDLKGMLGILDLRLIGYYKIYKGFCNKISVNSIDFSKQTFYVNNLINL